MKKIILLIFIINIHLFAEQIYATFDVVAKQSANLAFSASGIIKDIKVDIGSEVKKGAILASLNNQDLQASLNIVNTTLKYAKKDLLRQEKIKNIIDQEKYDSFEQKYESAKAQVQYQKALLDKTILKAPFNGVIISKEIEIGDVVSGQVIKTAFKIQSKSNRKLLLSFDQKYNGIVKKGDIFTYTLDGSDRKYQGKITKVYPYSDTKTRKIKAEVETKNLLVGLFGDGYIEVN